MMKQISPTGLLQLMSSGEKYFLLDVREDFEHEDFNIGGALIPLGEIINQSNTIPTAIPVIIYCRKGIRSQIAIQRLEDKFGFTNLINLEGGVEKLRNDADYTTLNAAK